LNTFTRVVELSTGKEWVYFCDPRKAVIACYAQQVYGDYNTWNYERFYSHRIEETDNIISCGDFSAFKKMEEIE